MYLLPPSFSSFFLFFFSPPPPPPLTLLVTPPPPPLFSSSSLLPSPLLRLPYPLLSSPLMGRGGILLVYLDTWCLRSYLPLPSLYLVLPPLLPPSPFSDSLSLPLCFLLFFPFPFSDSLSLTLCFHLFLAAGSHKCTNSIMSKLHLHRTCT